MSDDLGMYLRNNMGGILGCALIIWAKMRNHRKAAMLAPQGRDGALFTSVPFQTLFLALPMVVIPSSELVHRLALWAPGHSPGPQEASTLTVHSASLLWGADGTKL